MKSTFKLGSIEIQGVKVNDIEFTQEYTASEAMQLMSFGKQFMKEVIDETPAILESLETAFNKFNEIDERVEQKEIQKRKLAPDTSNMMDSVLKTLANLGITPKEVKIVTEEY